MKKLHLLVATVTAALLAVVLPSPAFAADAQLQLKKSTKATVIEPGQQFSYDLTLTCSSLTAGCVDATITDTLPAEFDVTSLPPSSSERTVTYDAATRLLTVKFVIPLSNPVGQSGLPAGASRKVELGMRLPAETPVTNGQEIPNTADGTAENADPVSDSVEIIAVVPEDLRPVALKSWADNSAIALSGSASTLEIGVRNASSTSTTVKALSITDDDADTFNAFDVTSLGPVTTFPVGADSVVVGVCTKPIGSPCADGEWIESAPDSAAGPFNPPGGTALADITGVRFTFTNSNGDPLPQSTTAGRVEVGLELRDTYRSDGEPLRPQNETVLTNSAVPSATPETGDPANGSPANASFTLLPDTVQVKATKKMYSDPNGSWQASGQIVVGENSGISMDLGVQNTSAMPLTAMVITEPAPGSPNEFDKINLTNGRVVWPTGATEATMEVTCRGGATPTPVPVPRTGDRTNLPDFNCPGGDYPGSITVTFIGVDKDGLGTIAPKAKAGLDLHGLAAGVDSTDVSNTLTNCVDASGRTPEASSAESRVCAFVPVYDPAPGGTSAKTPRVSTVVPGQYLEYDLTFRNSGNVALDSVVLTDPVDPTTGGNPFDRMRLQSVSLTTGQKITREVYDPNVPGFVAYNSSNTALMTRATGWRITLDQPLQPGERVSAVMRVMLRDGVVPTSPVETVVNCFRVTSEYGPLTTACGNVYIEGEDAGAKAAKFINPARLTRPTPGLPPQRTTVRYALANTGTLYLGALGITDTSQDFFDAVDFVGNMQARIPAGANRVQVDVCTTDCAGGTFINGTPTASSTPGLPSGVQAKDVRGIRVTFFNSGGGYTLLPGDYFYASGTCKDANFCFDVTARENLRGTDTPIPDTLENIAEPFGTSGLGPLTIPDVKADIEVVDGTAAAKFRKGPDTRIGPGDVAPFDLVLENPGTAALQDPVIYDPLPADLTFVEDAPGGKPGEPYVISYSGLPSGYPQPGSVTFDTERDDPVDENKISGVRWSFQNWDLPPGGKVTIRFYVTLSPGVLADTEITNTGGASASNTFTCDGTSDDQEPWTPGTYCTDPAIITSLAGNATLARKWSSGDPALGFLNTISGKVIEPGEPGCPSYSQDDRTYTRYPCVPQVGPNEPIYFLIEMINAGTNPMTKAVIVDGLPVEGDTGVLVPNSRETEWNNRPVMLTPIKLEGVSESAATTSYTDLQFPPDMNEDPSNRFCKFNLDPAPRDRCPDQTWDDPFSESVTGFRTQLDMTSKPLPPGAGITLNFQMLSPVTLDTNDGQPQAWNSFGQKSTFTTGEEPASEPLKAGAAMRFGQVEVLKSVVGAPRGVTLLPFELAYSCSVGETEVGSGQFSLDADVKIELPLQPTGATCKIWEIDSQGASSEHIGEENAIVVTVPAPESQGGSVEKVSIRNDYENGQLKIRKRVTGDAADLPLKGGGTVGGGEFSVNVSCEFPSGNKGKTLPDFPQTVTISGGQTVTVDTANGTQLPASSDCIVTETATGNASAVEVAVDDGVSKPGTTAITDIAPDFDGGTTVTLDNQYEAGALKISKTLSGPGSDYAQGPYTFSVECTYASQELEPIGATVTAKDLQTTVSPLPTGAACAVYETDAGDSQSPVPTLIGNVLIPGADDPAVEVSADNTYVAGYVTASKQVDGAAADLVGDNSYQMQVICERDKSGGGTERLLDKSVTLTAGESKTLTEPIPVGARCWMVETSDGGASSTTINHSSAGSAAVVTEAKPNLSITATNTFEARTLRVSKKTSGAAPAKARYGFAVSCTMPGGTVVQLAGEDAAFTLAAGEARSITVPHKADCSVTETDDRGARQTQFTDSDGGTDGSLVVDSDARVQVKNVFTDVCSLTVRARKSGAKVSANGISTLVKSAKTSKTCAVKSQQVRRPGVTVRCTPLQRTVSGEVRYCQPRIGPRGRVRVQTFGKAPLRIRVTIKATPNKKGIKAKSWQRTFRTR